MPGLLAEWQANAKSLDRLLYEECPEREESYRSEKELFHFMHQTAKVGQPGRKK